MSSQIIDPGHLKKARIQVGLTQKSLAEKAGVSQSVVAKIEAGKVDPTFHTLAAISRALNSRLATSGKRAVDVMTSPVIGVRESATLSECVELMKERSISQMPVFSDKRMIGTVTEAQIMALVSDAQEPSKILSQQVRGHILPAFAVVGKDTPVEAMMSLFRLLPAVLVSSGDEMVGIVTKIDVLAGA